MLRVFNSVLCNVFFMVLQVFSEMWNGKLETLFEWSDKPLKGLSVNVFLPLSNVV